jgi:Cu+-exporting ATPase
MLGRYLEIVAKGKTSDTLKKLMELQATTATLLTSSDNNMQEQEIDANLIQRDDLLKVTPGSKIPTDGIIVQGYSSVNEAMITGESLPVNKGVNSSVYGGTINQQGVIHVRATKCVGESTVSNIVQLVQEAQSSKAPIQRIGDVISSYFVPIIVALSVAVFIIWISLAASDSVETNRAAFPFALQFFIAVLVISCPCAVGLAVPTAIMVGTGVGAKLGVLFKGGSVIEICHKVNVIVFDKTGTLTYGQPLVTKYEVFEHKYKEQFLAIVGSAELGSEHVIGKAIVKYAQEKHTLKEPSKFVATPGKGFTCVVRSKSVIVGNKQWLKENGNKIYFQ